jgi:hypothetical protein
MQYPRNLSVQAITDLLAITPTAPAVTIYLPTHRGATPPQISQDQIRSKNLFRQAADILKQRDDAEPVTTALSRLLEELKENRDFWENQTEGLLILARPNQVTMFHLPIETQQYVAVADQFHLAPVFGLLNRLHRYYVLVLTQHEPAVLLGDTYALQQSDIVVPTNVAEGLHLDESNAKSEQQRSTGAGGGFNGRGADHDSHADDRLRFWRQLDTIMCRKADTTLPLILAGTDSEISEYRAISHYPQLLPDNIAGSFGGANPHDLFNEASRIIRRAFDERQMRTAILDYTQTKGQSPDQAAADFAAISKAADGGRVAELLVAGYRYTTDSVSDRSDRVPIISFPPEESAQAVEEIARCVYASSGSVVLVDADAMPEPGALMLARLRY